MNNPFMPGMTTNGQSPEREAETYAANTCVGQTAQIFAQKDWLAGHRSRDAEVQALQAENAAWRARWQATKDPRDPCRGDCKVTGLRCPHNPACEPLAEQRLDAIPKGEDHDMYDYTPGQMPEVKA